MNSKIKQNLDWLFHFNKDKNDFINFINARGGNWAESLSELIQNLKRKGAQGIQDKFGKLGFNVDNAYIQLKPLFCELEVGDFISGKGEKVIFLEGQNSPDMISGIKKFDKVWEISTVFDSPEIKDLWIEGNKIIKSWKQNVECDIKLSLNLSGFQPEKSYHENFDKIVKNSLKELIKFDPMTLSLDKVKKIRTPMIYFVLKLSNNSFSGISTMQEGAIEEMAFLENQNYIDSWVSQFQNRIIKKSHQIINDIQKVENNGTNKWEKDNNRIIALVSDADVFYDKYFSQTCFGSMDIHKTKYINDPRVIRMQHSNPWREYIKKHYFDDYGNPLKEPKGVFLTKETEEIHGVLFISSNRRPIDHKFLANPFVLKNNDTGIIKYLF
jgi:Txe/YoeB family toxin of Txe-Axe toxin-antitoxin module